MAKYYQKQSALSHLRLAARALVSASDADVMLSEQSFRGQIALRGAATDRKFKAVVKKVFGVALPVKANTVSDIKKGYCLIWLGPDEWLAVVPDGKQAKVVADLYAAMDGAHFAAVDVSSSRTVIRLAGACAQEVLMKGCSLDLHPGVFAAGQCAQSSLARCHVLLYQTDDAPSYDVYVHRSFADYLFRWLEDAAGEFGVIIVD